MKKNVVKGEIFIIPNRIAKSDVNEYLTKHLNRKNEFLGLPEVMVGEKLIQVWFTDEESENWTSHGKMISGIEYSEDVKEKWFQSLWPGYLKKEMLEGLKEGDKLTLNLKNGVVVELTTNQEGYRYRNFGKFEEVLETM